jgi:Type I phosphodiesterase / nucleotide pyrophosphatase
VLPYPLPSAMYLLPAMNDPRVIALEFNELTPRLMKRWIDEGRLPGFQRLYSESMVYVTDAEEQPPYLEPWIQWITVHTGLPYAKHGVFDLGDGHKLDVPRLWDMVSDAGKRAWICGSMNAGVREGKFNGAILPDPWSAGVSPYPPGEFEAFFDLVRTHVQEYASDNVPLKSIDYARFGTFMLRHGLSPTTVKKTIAQLASERGGKNKWKRAMILDRLFWDLFRSHWRKHQPHYSTLFLNSTAHLQHYYWRNMEPDSFKLKPTDAEQSQYHDAIFAGYLAMDALVQEALELVAGTNTSLVLVTALSQQPLLRYEDEGGKLVFKPHDSLELLRFAGSSDTARYAPVMAEEYHLYFDSDLAAERGVQALEAMTLDGQQVMRARRDGSELYVACAIIRTPPEDAVVTVPGSGRSALFTDLFFPLQGLKSGCHHPDGMLWIRTPARRHRVATERVSLRRVAPTLAALAGLPATTIAAAFEAAPLALAEPAQDVRQREAVAV